MGCTRWQAIACGARIGAYSVGAPREGVDRPPRTMACPTVPRAALTLTPIAHADSGGRRCGFSRADVLRVVRGPHGCQLAHAAGLRGRQIVLFAAVLAEIV